MCIRDRDRELQNKNEDLQKRMEALFAWMLPQIDYEDTDAVQFMYRFYNKVRKLGFSKELLETYIPVSYTHLFLYGV